MTTIPCWIVLRKDGTPKVHVMNDAYAVFTSERMAKAVIQSGDVVEATLTYTKPKKV